jgi:hypothetical protein
VPSARDRVRTLAETEPPFALLPDGTAKDPRIDTKQFVSVGPQGSDKRGRAPGSKVSPGVKGFVLETAKEIKGETKKTIARATKKNFFWNRVGIKFTLLF